VNAGTRPCSQAASHPSDGSRVCPFSATGVHRGRFVETSISTVSRLQSAAALSRRLEFHPHHPRHQRKLQVARGRVVRKKLADLILKRCRPRALTR
jgi:hypothetical protein